MSNHAGSHMLNDVLHILEREGVFQWLGLEKTRKLMVEISEVAEGKYDCNPGEVLDEIGRRHQLCYFCLKPAQEFDEFGLCSACRSEEDD